MIPNFKH